MRARPMTGEDFEGVERELRALFSEASARWRGELRAGEAAREDPLAGRRAPRAALPPPDADRLARRRPPRGGRERTHRAHGAGRRRREALPRGADAHGRPGAGARVRRGRPRPGRCLDAGRHGLSTAADQTPGLGRPPADRSLAIDVGETPCEIQFRPIELATRLTGLDPLPKQGHDLPGNEACTGDGSAVRTCPGRTGWRRRYARPAHRPRHVLLHCRQRAVPRLS